MPSAPILTLGSRWLANDVYWHTSAGKGQLLGVRSTAKRGPVVNFAEQSGIYVLYSEFVPIYVGQANQRLFARLKEHHLKDDFVGRWDRFSWFGFRRVVGGTRPKLSVAGVRFSISTGQLLDHMEALLIHAAEPRLNGQEGRFGGGVERFKQVRDGRLGPNDRDFLEEIAVVGDFVPRDKRITKTGWKPALARD